MDSSSIFLDHFFYQGECSSYRLDEEQYQPILDQMLAADREKTESLLKSKGEERMRFKCFVYIITNVITNTITIFSQQEGWPLAWCSKGWILRHGAMFGRFWECKLAKFCSESSPKDYAECSQKQQIIINFRLWTWWTWPLKEDTSLSSSLTTHQSTSGFCTLLFISPFS